ncbi:MAG: HlyD family efflux transporter periplasmic adaptor subunit [Gammaproteobacteria bacterium]|nr:HlyD family efflux transporter periplasmic adaptor subunit [Gammaproteobacteria bacterium]
MKKTVSQQWLEIVCSTLPGAKSAILMLPDPNSKILRPLAKWPESLEEVSEFTKVVKYALKKNEPTCFPKADKSGHRIFDLFAVPVPLQLNLSGVLLVKLGHMQEARQKSIFAYLKQSLRWLKFASPDQKFDDDFFSRVVSLLASCFEQSSYQQGLVAMVSELTQAFNCERVAFAEYQNHYSTVVALSNSATFDANSNLIQSISAAMDEAVEQDSAIIFPNEKSSLIHRTHQELARKFGTGSVCSMPMVHDKKIIAAITLLRDQGKPFNNHTVMLLEQTFALITPYLALKREQEKSLFYKFGKSLKNSLQQLLGLRYLKVKLVAIFLATLLLTGSLLEGDFRVSADAVLEGKIQRVVAAPFAGYLLSAAVQAGDTVRQNEVMASLDDVEINLQLTKLKGELQKFRREFREAQSNRDLVKVRIIKEQINQVEAEIELALQQLKKITLTAPFDGVVIEGDLTQSLGSPIERGEVLFKIAPLEGYRIILKIDEKQISYIKQGQIGILVLPGMSDQQLALTVEKITAASKAENGSNIFRVEASLDESTDRLRPGMQGVGKIYIGQARLVWLWTHEVVEWIQLWFWTWLP